MIVTGRDNQKVGSQKNKEEKQVQRYVKQLKYFAFPLDLVMFILCNHFKIFIICVFFFSHST